VLLAPARDERRRPLRRSRQAVDKLVDAAGRDGHAGGSGQEITAGKRH
jgi:hypothetical protein